MKRKLTKLRPYAVGTLLVLGAMLLARLAALIVISCHGAW
jgi:hypothetical protein